jgi:hypothetical protein
LLLWQLIEARQPDQIAQLEALAATTQRAAVDYAIDRSGFRDFFPGFARGRGRPATRLARHTAIFPACYALYLVAGLPLMPDDAAR